MPRLLPDHLHGRAILTPHYGNLHSFCPGRSSVKLKRHATRAPTPHNPSRYPCTHNRRPAVPVPFPRQSCGAYALAQIGNGPLPERLKPPFQAPLSALGPPSRRGRGTVNTQGGAPPSRYRCTSRPWPKHIMRDTTVTPRIRLS
ncbi:hypothetical protein C8Q80DRAFT_814294 [Daedaleopsis nitida]|nr:hypothetical protein C8Q80DRAFT_814294 [Daedaleopsis nitida]